MTDLIPAGWMPAVPMKRIHGHWTAGGHRANATDLRAYHILVEGDAKVLKGVPSIAANSGGTKDGYAAHTLNANSDAIGVSMCGMMGATESPFNAGPAPLTQVQWDAFVRAVAELARFYKIPIGPKTILFHAEVQANLGIAQRNKWDVIRLPFDPTVSGAKAVGDKLRREVAALLAGEAPVAPPEPVPAGGVARVTASSLNFRRTPNGEATGLLPRGTTLEVLGISGEWMHVRTPAGFEGWVSRLHVEMVDGPPPVQPTVPDPRRALLNAIRRQLDELEASF